MATSSSTIAYLEDQLATLPGVHSRKMFGEYALSVGEKVVALVCDDTLFVKMTPPGKEFVGVRCEEGAAYPGATPSLRVGEEMVEDRSWLCELIRITEGALPVPKPKKKRIASKKRV